RDGGRKSPTDPHRGSAALPGTRDRRSRRRCHHGGGRFHSRGLLQPVRIEGGSRRGGLASGPRRVERAMGAGRQRNRQTPRPRENHRRLPVAAPSKLARKRLRRRSARLGPPPAVEEGPGSLHEETRGGSRGARWLGTGEGGITSPRLG